MIALQGTESTEQRFRTETRGNGGRTEIATPTPTITGMWLIDRGRRCGALRLISVAPLLRANRVSVVSVSGGFMSVKARVMAGAVVAFAIPALAQQPNGEAVFKQSCASCHNENQKTAPTRDVLAQMTPESIFNALTLGRMQIQAISLSEADQRRLLEYARALVSAEPFPRSPLPRSPMQE